MTWNELAYTILHSIPEDRREEQAVFWVSEAQDNWIIDGIEEVNEEKVEDFGPWACNVGNEDMTSTYTLIP